MGFDEAKSNSSQVKRKERAKLAARLRRSQEATVIKELAFELSIPSERVKRVDKAMIVKLSIDYLRARQALLGCPFDVAVTRLDLMLKSDQQALAARQRAANVSATVNASITREIARPFVASRDSIATTAITATPTTTKTSIAAIPNSATPTTTITTTTTNAITPQAGQQTSIELCLPKFSTQEIFAPKTHIDEVESHFLILSDDKGRTILELNSDADLTNLAPKAGDSSILIEVEPLDGIQVDCLFDQSPPHKHSEYAPDGQSAAGNLEFGYVQTSQQSAHCDRKRIGLLWHKQNS